MRLAAQAVEAGTLLSHAARILPDALALLRERRGLDFNGYRTATLERRVANRMVAARATEADSYLALLAASESEIDSLAANLTIKVSRFYRNAAVFDVLRESIVPTLRQHFGGALNVWSAGCATGEEAYSLAMLLGPSDRVQATDIDESALARARSGLYAAEAVAELPDAMAAEFVHGSPTGFIVSDELRRRVLFSRHDLARETSPPHAAPFHLICCRNVLIYFAPPLQCAALRLLVESLVPGGILCLGEAEWPPVELRSLEVIDRRRKIFRRRNEEVRP